MFSSLIIAAAFRSRWRYGFRTNARSLRNCWSKAVTRMRATLSQAQRPCRRARQRCLQCGTFPPQPRASVCPPTATCLAIRIGTPLHIRTRCKDHRWCELSEGSRYPREASEQGKEDPGPACSCQTEPKEQARENSYLARPSERTLSLTPPFLFLLPSFFPSFPPFFLFFLFLSLSAFSLEQPR